VQWDFFTAFGFVESYEKTWKGNRKKHEFFSSTSINFNIIDREEHQRNKLSLLKWAEKIKRMEKIS
jgi:hypothetical protein